MTRLGEQQPAAAATEARSIGARGAAAQRIRTAGSVLDFSLSLERPGDGTAVLALSGELDLYRAPEIEAAMAEAVGGEGSDRDGERCRLVVDLRAVTFVDSTMLGLLLAASRGERARGAELRILVGPETPMTAFVVTGVDRLLAIRLVGNGSSESSTRSGETTEGASGTTAVT